MYCKDSISSGISPESPRLNALSENKRPLTSNNSGGGGSMPSVTALGLRQYCFPSSNGSTIPF